MDLKLCLLLAVSAVLLENHLGSAAEGDVPDNHNRDISTGAYSFVFEYIWVGGTSDSRNTRTPEYQVGLDVGLAVGLGFGIPLCIIIAVLIFGLTCQDRLAKMDQEEQAIMKAYTDRQRAAQADAAERKRRGAPAVGEVYEMKETGSATAI